MSLFTLRSWFEIDVHSVLSYYESLGLDQSLLVNRICEERESVRLYVLKQVR